MKKYSGNSSCGRKCVVCGKKTGNHVVWCYVDGIEISVPVCQKCRPKFGWCLDTAMNIHLKGIAESIRHSIIITSDEKWIDELQDELKRLKGVQE